MTLKTKMLDDFKNVFLNSDEFAESITYTPSGSTAKSIKALVVRSRVSPDPQAQNRIVANQVELYIAKDSTSGVATVSRGNDTVSLPTTIGGTSVTWRIVDIIGHDDAAWHLLAQK